MTLTLLEKKGGKRPGCWGHGRRRFVEAARLSDALALEALRLIAPIFRVERDATLAGDSAEARYGDALVRATAKVITGASEVRARGEAVMRIATRSTTRKRTPSVAGAPDHPFASSRSM